VINSVVLVGRLTKDPEMRYTPNGVAVTRFRIAVDRRTARDEQGNREADFIDITAWRKTAELCGQYLSKGAPVGIEGRIRTGSYTTQDGQQRQRFEVVADNVSFLETRAEREQREARHGAHRPPSDEAPTDYEPPPMPMESEDPFGDQ
jgi:single-strand DNA-binding protein